MDDPSWVTEVDAIDELEHDESYLLLSDGVLVLRQVFFEIVLCILKHEVKLFLTGSVDYIH